MSALVGYYFKIPANQLTDDELANYWNKYNYLLKSGHLPIEPAK